MLVSVLRYLKAMLLIQCAWVLLACGSGGGGGGETLPPLPPAPVAPAISVQPVAVAVATGQPATFSVTATGTAPQYQWRKNGVPIAGATAASYTLPAAAPSDNNAQITVVVANIVGSITSVPVAITITDLVVAPTLVRPPLTNSVVAGSTASFDVVAGGTAPFTYQWFRDGAAIQGAVRASYSLVSTLADNGAQLSVTVSNSAGTVVSQPVTLRVTANFVPVGIAVQPQDVTVRNGENATISVVLEGTGPFTWRWFRNGVDTQLGGNESFVTSHLFLFAPAVLADNGALISVRVFDAAGNVVISRQALVTVLP